MLNPRQKSDALEDRERDETDDPWLDAPEWEIWEREDRDAYEDQREVRGSVIA